MERPDAKQAMVDAAEALMAERGIGAISLREVQATAGQKNKSAAHYHFGSREGLIKAILEARVVPVMARRREMLEQLDREGRAHDLRFLVEAFVEPIVEMSVARPNSSYARFLAQAYRDDILVRVANEAAVRGAYWDWYERVEAALGHIPPELRPVRIDQITSMIINTLALWESGRADTSLPLDVRLEDLIDSCVAVFEGATSDVTRAALRAAKRRRA